MKKIYVLMPYGDRSANEETHGVKFIPFDLVYKDVILAAGKAAGWPVLRSDELIQLGSISEHYLREIFISDLAICDVSVPNANVFYELGIRQAISSAGTILIAHEGTELPFDIHDQRVLFYNLSAEGLQTARAKLQATIEAVKEDGVQNPIRRYLETIGAVSGPTSNAVGFEQELRGKIDRARSVGQLLATWSWAKHLDPLPPLSLIALAEKLANFQQWSTASEILQVVLEQRPNDYEVHRQLGWYLRHQGKEFEGEAIACFERALGLNPSDPETLGMLAGLFKRQGKFAKAAEYYSKGAAISPSNLYMRVTRAAMEILSKPSEPESGVRLYEELLSYLSEIPPEEANEWTPVVKAEASFAVGDDTQAKSCFTAALLRFDSAINNVRSSLEQIKLLGSYGFRSRAASQLTEEIEGIIRAKELGLKVSLRDAPTEALAAEALPVIIHLSDLHFGSCSGESGKPISMHRFRNGDYTQRLSQHLVEEFASVRRHFHLERQRLYLAVSGDLAYTATEGEFELARGFLEETCEGLGISKDRVVIAPGNHDINWHAAEDDIKKRFDNYIVFLSQFYGEDLFYRLYPLITWDLHIHTSRPEPSKLISVACFPEANLTITSLNSCVYEDNQHHYGFVGRKQLDHVRELLDRIDPSQRAVRVAVLHHHLHPFPEPIDIEGNSIQVDQSTIKDAGLVERRLERLNFDIVLHGHKHKPQLRETVIRGLHAGSYESKPLLVCGSGSCGVNPRELEHDQPNHYQVLEFLRVPRVTHADFVKIEWRELAASAEAEWVTPESWTLLG